MLQQELFLPDPQTHGKDMSSLQASLNTSLLQAVYARHGFSCNFISGWQRNAAVGALCKRRIAAASRSYNFISCWQCNAAVGALFKRD